MRGQLILLNHIKVIFLSSPTCKIFRVGAA
jgi:hypothetical protein